MGYEARTVQSVTTNTLPDSTDPAVDNTIVGDVQLIKLLDPTEGSVTPLIGQQARAGSVPAALSTEDAALLADLLTTTAFQARSPALVAGRVPVDGSGVTQPISAASLPLPTGASTASNQTTANASLSSIDGKLPALSGGAVPVADGGGSLTVDGTFWQATQPVSGPLTDAQLRASAVPTKEARAATPVVSSVAGSASNVTLLAANTDRLGATIYNDSSALLYVKLGTTASATSFTALLAGNGGGVGGYYEVPFGYTGQIDGLWASATGNARITELT